MEEKTEVFCVSSSRGERLENCSSMNSCWHSISKYANTVNAAQDDNHPTLRRNKCSNADGEKGVTDQQGGSAETRVHVEQETKPEEQGLPMVLETQCLS